MWCNVRIRRRVYVARSTTQILRRYDCRSRIYSSLYSSLRELESLEDICGCTFIQLRMQVMERGIIPYPLLLMLPYILTLVALSVAVLGKKNPPKGLFFPYRRGGQ
jgi:hypothetical protein